MEEKEIKTIDLVQLSKIVWGKRKRVIKWAVIGLFLGVIVWLSKPNVYTATTVMAPESKQTTASSSSLGAMASLVGVTMPGAESEGVSEKLYPRIVASTPFLMEFPHIKVPYQKDTVYLYEYLDSHQNMAWWSYVFKVPGMLMKWAGSIFSDKVEKSFAENQGLQEKFAGKLAGSISVKIEKEDKVIAISVAMQDPTIAAIVADSVFNKLSHYMLQYRTERSRNNLNSSVGMFTQAKDKYYIADSTYAAISDRNQNMISQAAKIKVERLKNERDLAFTIYQQLASQVEINHVRLLEETPIATVIEPVKIPLGPSSPNMIVTIFMFTFLGGFFSTGLIVVKELMKK